MRINRTVLLMIAILIASAVAVSADPADGYGGRLKGQLPEELYPDADVILTADADGNTLMTFKAYGDYIVDDAHPSVWFTETVSGKDLTIRDICAVSGSLSIVFDGADLETLTLLSIDSKAALNASVDVDFTMVSGEIRTFSLMSVPDSILEYMGASYDALPMQIHTANLDFRSGTLDLFDPTSQMLGVTNLYLSLGSGMSVNRLYTTGENGKYSDVYVTVSGAHIGYMANIASKIGHLEYDIGTGEIDYFCIGADTEHSSNKTLSSMATSYVSGDVDLNVGESASVDNCIMGAGILSMPRMLCNGARLSADPTHMVAIEAPGIAVCNDTAFLNESRDSAYHFDNYRVGQSPYIRPISDSFVMDQSTVKVYSGSGVWESISSTVLPAESILSLNTDFVIQKDSMFTVSRGALLVNAGDIALHGTLNIEGTLVNNSVIQCMHSSEIVGETEGIGNLAGYVYYSNETNSLDVISQMDAVVIELREKCAIKEISVTFANLDVDVAVKVCGTTCIYGDRFVISLTASPGTDGFEKIYGLDIMGIDRSTLASCTVDLYLPVDPQVCNAIYIDPAKDGWFTVLSTSEYAPQIKVPAGTNTEFYLYTYTAERPDYEPAADTSMSGVDYALIAVIIVFLAAALYALITMRRV